MAINRLMAATFMVLVILGGVSCSCGAATPEDTVEDYPRKVSLKEAGEIMGEQLPVPSYLPQGFEIKGIYLTERSENSVTMALLISDEAIDEETLSSKIKMDLTLYRKGQVGGLKFAADLGINLGKERGTLVTREDTNDIYRILPHTEPPGQYMIILSAIKEIPLNELIKIAESVV